MNVLDTLGRSFFYRGICKKKNIYFRAVMDEVAFIDKTRTAVMGQNYGGFLATSLLARREVQYVQEVLSICIVSIL